MYMYIFNPFTASFKYTYCLSSMSTTLAPKYSIVLFRLFRQVGSCYFTNAESTNSCINIFEKLLPISLVICN
jgi:hypothetical protein